MKLGRRISALRKERGLTQEMLARQLGVSAAAVSKWENDAAYPDITLLCPLARTLGTDVDALLAFEQKMSREALTKASEEFVRLTRQGNQKAAHDYLNGLLKEYPNDCALKLNAASMFALMQLHFPNAGVNGQRRSLYEEVYESGDARQREAAASALASIALLENRLEDARRYLDEIPENTEDVTLQRVQLYQKTGEADKARAVIQKQLYRAVSQTLQTLMMLMEAKTDAQEALEIAEIYRKVEAIFAVGGGMSAGLLMQQYMKMGKRKEALECLKQMADAATGQPMTPNPTLFYPTLSPKTENPDAGREMKTMLLRGLKEDEELSSLRGEEEYEYAVKKLEKSLQR